MYQGKIFEKDGKFRAAYIAGSAITHLRKRDIVGVDISEQW